MTANIHSQSNEFSKSSSNATSDIVRQVAVIAAFISTIIVNALANIIPFGGRTTGDLSDMYDVFFIPAGYVFSIWSLIYLGLGAYTVYQAIPAQRDNPQLRAIGWLFVLSCIFNSAWIFVWHYQFVGLSILIMLALLASLMAIYSRLYSSYRLASSAEKIIMHWTFRVYLGWITVATIVNVTTFLDFSGYEGAPLAPEMWAAIMLAIATAIGLYFALKMRDVAYALVLVWAFVGIFIKFPDTPMVSYTALAMAILLATASVTTAIRTIR